MVFKRNFSAKQHQPLKLALAGLSHDHVQGALDRLAEADVLVVGIAEENQELPGKGRVCSVLQVKASVKKTSQRAQLLRASGQKSSDARGTSGHREVLG